MQRETNLAESLLRAVLDFQEGILHLNTTNGVTTKPDINTLPYYNKAKRDALPAIIHAKIRHKNEYGQYNRIYPIVLEVKG